MPYYCTVPRCTSLAGKAKNVSFHQFPKDQKLALYWNRILKRGKPFTKYSKVCSLHFTPADYVITSVGKNKGQWRTLRKDAVPSRNLPAETPSTTTHHRRTSTISSHSVPSRVPSIDPLQMAQAIYMQTILALHTGSSCAPQMKAWSAHGERSALDEGVSDRSASPATNSQDQCTSNTQTNHKNQNQFVNKASYKCDECSKCFKDPDVYLIHKRTHHVDPGHQETVQGKENKHTNGTTSQDTLRANPILANLLNTDGAGRLPDRNVYDTNALLSLENQVMAALNANMHNYILNLTMNTPGPSSEEKMDEESNGDNDEPSEGCYENEDSDEDNDGSSEGQSTSVAMDQADMLVGEELVRDAQTTVGEQSSSHGDRNVVNSNQNLVTDEDFDQQDPGRSDQNSMQNELMLAHEAQQAHNHLSGQSEDIGGSGEKESQGSDEMEEPTCDNKDLDYSKDSTNLLIDENT